MALPEPDIEVWAFAGGYVVRFDARESDTNPTRVCLTRKETLKQIERMLRELDDNGSADAVQRALKGK